MPEWKSFGLRLDILPLPLKPSFFEREQNCDGIWNSCTNCRLLLSLSLHNIAICFSFLSYISKYSKSFNLVGSNGILIVKKFSTYRYIDDIVQDVLNTIRCLRNRHLSTGTVLSYEQLMSVSVVSYEQLMSVSVVSYEQLISVSIVSYEQLISVSVVSCEQLISVSVVSYEQLISVSAVSYEQLL